MTKTKGWRRVGHGGALAAARWSWAGVTLRKRVPTRRSEKQIGSRWDLLQASWAQGGDVEGWRRCLRSLLQGGRWWRDSMVLRPRQGAKQCRGGPAMLLI
jgi:hypothetical protein